MAYANLVAQLVPAVDRMAEEIDKATAAAMVADARSARIEAEIRAIREGMGVPTPRPAMPSAHDIASEVLDEIEKTNPALLAPRTPSDPPERAFEKIVTGFRAWAKKTFAEWAWWLAVKAFEVGVIGGGLGWLAHHLFTKK